MSQTGHTDNMLVYVQGRSPKDSGWLCRRCKRKFRARASARQTPCEAQAPQPAETGETQ